MRRRSLNERLVVIHNLPRLALFAAELRDQGQVGDRVICARIRSLRWSFQTIVSDRAFLGGVCKMVLPVALAKAHYPEELRLFFRWARRESR